MGLAEKYSWVFFYPEISIRLFFLFAKDLKFSTIHNCRNKFKIGISPAKSFSRNFVFF